MSAKIKRREFITLLGGAAASVSTPLPLFAQEAGRIYRIGFVSAAPREEAWYTAFFEELRGLGFVEGQNLTVISGGFGVRNELLGEVAAALVKAAPDAIIAAGPIATRAAQAATKTIPILAASDDMVADGLVPSMRRPGGNTTGVSLLAPELDGKRQDLIMEVVPGIRRIAALSDPHVSTPQHLQSLKEGARARDVELLVCIHPGRDRTGHERGECCERSGSQRPGNAAVLLQSANRAGARYEIAIACDLPMAGNGGARWPRRLRPAHHAMVPSIGTAARPGAARGQSRRASRRAADKV